MAEFISIEGGFEQCEPPFCPEDIDIIITRFECNDGIVTVVWQIYDRYHRNFVPWIHRVIYAMNVSPLEAQAYDGIEQAQPGEDTTFYHAYFPKPVGPGSIYIVVNAVIGQTIYNATAIPLSAATCYGDSILAVKSTICPEYWHEFGAIGYSIWIKKSGVPSNAPIYFEYNGICLYISKFQYDNPSFINEITLNPSDILLDSVNSGGANIRSDCTSCTVERICPTQWIEDPNYPGIEAKQKAEIYIEYTTYTCRDNILVYGPDNGECEENNIIWQTGCVGTCRKEENLFDEFIENDPNCNLYPCEDGGEGPGTYIDDIGDYRGIGSDIVGFRDIDKGKDICVKQACISIRKEQLPVSVGVDAVCGDDGCSTYWCIYIEGPDFTYSKCAGESICGDIPDTILWSSSTSSVSSSSVSSSSNSSSSVSSSSNSSSSNSSSSNSSSSVSSSSISSSSSNSSSSVSSSSISSSSVSSSSISSSSVSSSSNSSSSVSSSSNSSSLSSVSSSSESSLSPYDCDTPTLTVTISGVVNCGEDTSQGEIPATAVNGTWVLTQFGGCDYRYSDATREVRVILDNDTGFIVANLATITHGQFDYNWELDPGHPVYRGGTFNNDAVCVTVFLTRGEDGTAYIHLNE